MNESAILPKLQLFAPPGFPRVKPGDDLTALIIEALRPLEPQPGDVLTVSSKLFSRSEGRFYRLSEVKPGERALELAAQTDKEPALVELILSESNAISRAAPGVLIVRHRCGFISANAGIDRSNAMPPGAPQESRSDWALLLPRDPQSSADTLRRELLEREGWPMGIVVTDSHGRPFRHGTTGVALGVSGLPALDTHEERKDLDGRPLEVTVTAVADQIASAADLVAGQADEGRPLVLLRGLKLQGEGNAADLLRDPQHDLYA